MTMHEYIESRGLTTRLVAQKMDVSRQALEHYGKKFQPTAKTLSRVAEAMTELGAPTTVLDIFKAIHAPKDGGEEGDEN